MINLLSPAAQKTLTKEYWLRVGSVWAFLVAGLCIGLTLLLIPTYVLVHSQLTSLSSEDAETEEVQGRFAAAEALIVEANELAGVMRKPISAVPFSKLYNEIEDASTPGIALKTFAFERVDGVVGTIQIQGEAKTRSTLLDFKSSIEKSPYFKEATVPLSDLVRESDLTFVVTVVPNADVQ